MYLSSYRGGEDGDFASYVSYGIYVCPYLGILRPVYSIGLVRYRLRYRQPDNSLRRIIYGFIFFRYLISIVMIGMVVTGGRSYRSS